MWFNLQSVTIEEARVGGEHIRSSILLPCTPELAYEYFSSDEHMPKWFQDLIKAEWKTEKEVGGIRELNLIPMRVRERFLVIAPGETVAFYFEAMTLPGMEWMAEEFTFEPVGSGQCQFTWNMYYRMKPGVALIDPVAKLILKNLTHRGVRGLKKYAARNATS